MRLRTYATLLLLAFVLALSITTNSNSGVLVSAQTSDSALTDEEYDILEAAEREVDSSKETNEDDDDSDDDDGDGDDEEEEEEEEEEDEEEEEQEDGGLKAKAEAMMAGFAGGQAGAASVGAATHKMHPRAKERLADISEQPVDESTGEQDDDLQRASRTLQSQPEKDEAVDTPSPNSSDSEEGTSTDEAEKAKAREAALKRKEAEAAEAASARQAEEERRRKGAPVEKEAPKTVHDYWRPKPPEPVFAGGFYKRELYRGGAGQRKPDPFRGF
ncbi:hypothetical protein PPROV_001055700 [Pycnococcus provasolii]|uniref:Uncharacterized protein n=1 Tax=Pycnococcus provasolii TaxID=41880 RepID=A0A830I174_9CHLO|nr:hypothetical protein PPROV_001055700 [Pycnococcus provasolii]